MDITALRERIQATLDANADRRRQAELDLKYAEEQPGFPNALIEILQTEQESAVKLSTVVYLKNRINRGWTTSSEEANIPKPIPREEKQTVRERLLPLLASSPPQIRSQLIPILQKILQCDFPLEWTNFVQITINLLNTNDANSLYAGLQCVLALTRTYRFKAGENRADFNNIVQATFPQVLAIATRLLDETSLEAGEMLRIAVKCYKHAIYFDLPNFLREHDQMVGWCTLFIRVVSLQVPENAMSEDTDERETNHWWKCKKWAYANLNRLFVRYGNSSTLPKPHLQEYQEFSKFFMTNFAPEILKAYLGEIEKWVAKTTWLSRPVLTFTLNFLDDCIKPKSTWDHLKPHMENILAHVVFPLLCQADEDLELFETDPQEYVHRKLNFYEEITAPDVAAATFLVSLTKSRKKQTFLVLNFVNGIVTRYETAPEAEKNPREKEGALRMIGTLSEVLLAKKSPIAHQVESFFVRHVFPEFRSTHGFLRARACDTLQKFDRLDFSDESNLILIYRNVLESMTDPDLPVRVEAAMALQVLIRHEVISNEMRTNIPQIMQQLLKLANEVDVDSLANVMEDFVEVFAAELTPFAVALTEQLRDTYLRIVRDIVERQNNKDGEPYGDYLDDKSITALGVLQTIGTLILTLESTPEVLLHLETILMPLVSMTLDNKLYDLYNDVFEIIDSCTFSAKAISPTMWQAFELMHKTFKSGAELYLEDMLPALDNFLAYGSTTMVQNPSYIDAVFSMVQDIFNDDKVGGMDRICACKLAESIMLSLRGHIDQYISHFIEISMEALTNDELKIKSYRIHLLEMIINAIYYNPTIALHYLESKDWTNKFFSLWFSNIENMTRVQDKKLSILAISSLLTLRADEVPTSVQQGWPRLLQGVCRLFQTLPAAIRNREAVTEENHFQLRDDDDEDEDEWEGEQEWTNEGEENEGDVKDESAAYVEFLNEEARKFGAISEEDDDLQEEGTLESMLDKIEPYTLFKNTLMKLQTEQPQLYESLTKMLNQEEQGVIQNVIMQANAEESIQAAHHAQAQVLAQQQQQQSQPPSQPQQTPQQPSTPQHPPQPGTPGTPQHPPAPQQAPGPSNGA